jgi:uncharacterized protein YndB with AHSA1/START domain
MVAATSQGTATVTLPADNEILITREFNAPKHLVYRVYTTPELVKRWWGANHGEVTVADIDLRVGGTWRYVLISDGHEVAFHGEYREIVENERLVMTEVYELPGAESPAPEDEPVNIVTFTEKDGRTTLSVLVQTSTQEIRDLIVNSGMESGMQASYDALERVAVELG